MLCLMVVSGEVVKTIIMSPLTGFLTCKWSYLDGIVVVIVLIRVLVCLLCLVCSEFELNCETVFRRPLDNFELVIVLRIFRCVLTFCSANWFSFFMFYEFSLIPIMYIILKWGYQPERLKAAMSMATYSVCGGLPLLFNLVIFKGIFSTRFFVVGGVLGRFYESFSRGVPWFVWFFFLVSFMVKFPVYGLHD